MMSDLSKFLGLAEVFSNHQFKLYLVGGAVRDQLLGKPIKDYDFATDAHPENIKTILKQFGAKGINTIGEKFGTVMAVVDDIPVEITTFRGESYEESSRKPEVEFSDTIEEDLSRRDFTINAIAYDALIATYIDIFGGKKDLEDKIIRAVGEAKERFSEDPLRMLRAIRFASQLGFDIEENTLDTISTQIKRIEIVSKERVADELNKILLSPKPSVGIRFLIDTGLLNYIIPELKEMIDLEFDPREHKDVFEHTMQVLDNTPADLKLRFVALLHDIAKPKTRQKIAGEYHFHGHEVYGSRIVKEILRRYKYPNDFIDAVKTMVFLHQRIPSYDKTWSDGGVRRFVVDAGEHLEDLFTIAKADLTSKNERKIAQYSRNREELYDRIKELEKQAETAKIQSPLTGDELMKIFNKDAGPWIKPIKDHLRDLVLDGKLKQTDKLEAEKIARDMVDKD